MKIKNNENFREKLKDNIETTGKSFTAVIKDNERSSNQLSESSEELSSNESDIENNSEIEDYDDDDDDDYDDDDDDNDDNDDNENNILQHLNNFNYNNRERLPDLIDLDSKLAWTVLVLIISVIGFFIIFAIDLRKPAQSEPKLSNWEKALIKARQSLETGVSVEGISWPLGNFNCTTMNEIDDLEFIGSGWTKSVYKGTFRGDLIAIKTVNLDGIDMKNCLELTATGSLATCYRRTSAKILKELILLNELKHDTVVKVYGSCIPDALGPVVIATELGKPVTTSVLLDLSWQDRMKLALGVARFIRHLATSEMGSVAMREFKSQQFVIVDGELKLTDADEIELNEPFCSQHSDCNPPRDPYNITEPEPMFCVKGKCDGYNERVNIIRAGQHVIKQFLPTSASVALVPHIKELLEAYDGFKNWNSAKILKMSESLFYHKPIH